MSAIGARSAMIGGLVLAASHPAHGQPPQATIDQLDHAIWTVRDGAPSYVNSLAQTADGVLWIGSLRGLYRFDGIRFEQFELPPQPFPRDAINAIAGMPDSSLWIGFSTGGVSVLTQGQVINYDARDGLPAGRINGIARDSAGDVWVSSDTGLARLRHGRWQRMGLEQQYPGGSAGNIFVDRRGALWAPMASGVYVLPRGQGRFLQYGASSHSKEGGLRAVSEAPDGSVWGASLDLGLSRLSDSAGRPTTFRSEVAGVGRGIRGHVDRQANAWISTFGGGLIRVPLPTRFDESPRRATRGQPRIEKVPLVTGPNAAAMLEDREGNMWLGTGGGIERFRETALTPVALPTELRWPALAPAADGSIWVGSYSHPVSLMTDQLRPQPGAPTGVTCVYRDLNGGLWLGGARGIWYVAPGSSPSHRFTPVALPRDGRFGPIVAIARTLDGDLWVSSSAVLESAVQAMRGVFRLRDGVWSRASLPLRLADQAAFTVVADSAGRVWLGYQNRVVLVIGDSTRVYSDSALRVGLVTALSTNGRHLWIGGTTGLAMMDGKRFHTVFGTPAIREVTGIVETANGDLWVNGSDGVTHIRAVEIQRALNDPAYRVRGERFDEHDGLKGQPVQTVPRPTAIHGTDGRLWFTTSVGIAWIDPANISRNPKPPPVQVRALTTAGKTYDVARHVSLPARTTQLQLAYTALNLAKPDRIVFRYMLTGVDTAWVEVGTRREAFYTNLAPGSYRFRVTAANDDRVWNQAGASIEFEIPPSFTQTKAFIGLIAILIAAALMGAGWLLALLRQRQMARALQAQFAGQLAERARVARELHDTLLGDITGVTLQLAAGARRAASANDTAGIVELLSSLRTQIECTAVKVRRSVTAIRTAPDELLPLHQQLDNAAQRMFGETAVAVRFEHRGSPRNNPPNVESQIVGIATEALANALRHAECETVTIICTYGSREIHVLVRDDGRGFDSLRETPAGHWGLVGMRERAASIGARLSITSGSGAGTEVLLVIPRGRAGRWWWNRLG